MSLTKRILASVLFSCLFSNTALANTINLSNLSGGGEASHNCILEPKYDSESHWQECLICKEKHQLQQHQLSSVYTHPNATCSPSNKLITSCSLCDYSSEHPYQTDNHVLLRFECIYNCLVAICSKCGTVYQDSTKGDVFYYSNGQPVVDPLNPVLPNTLRDRYGRTSYVNRYRTATVSDASLVDYNISIDSSNYATITGVFHLPNAALDGGTMKHYMYMFGLLDGYGNGAGADVSPSSISRVNNDVYFTYRFKLRDKNADYINPGRYTIAVSCSKRYGGVVYEQKYELPYVDLYTNFTDPIITNTNLE